MLLQHWPCNNKPHVCDFLLQHADSEGALLGDRCSLQPASSVSTLASSLGEAQAQRPSVEDFINAREQLIASECDERLGSSPADLGMDSEKAKEAEEDEDEEGDSYKEDILMGDDQVADFASSVLAAISCWQYRSRALLSTHFTTDDQNKEADDLNSALKETETQSLRDKHEEGAGTEVHTTQVTVEDLCPVDCVSHHPEVPYCHTPESLHEASTPEPHNTSQQTTEEEEEVGSDSSSFHVEETSVLTNGELSEEEQEMVSHSKHMLDQASVIAECYINSFSRQSSLISEDLGSVACSSPLTDNEPLTSSSACLDLEKDIQVFTSSPEPHLSSHEPALNDLMQEDCRSTLSKQDRLLIHKIRRYYEHAEHQDVNFSIKRRESLSYIPAGLVRQLSRQLNSAPQEQATPLHRKELSRNRPTSWSVFDLPGLDKSQNNEMPQQSEPTSTDGTDEVFKPSSEMLKLWDEMDLKEESGEAQQTVEQSEDLLLQAPLNVSLESSERKNSEHHSIEDSLMSVTPSVSSPAVPAEEAESVNCKHENDHFSPEHLPKIISFRTSMDEDQILQDMGKMKNKVFQLARQYSQRIKNNRPMKWQKGQERGSQHGLGSMPAVQEEKMPFRKNGKPNLRLPLNITTQAVIHEVSSPSPVQTPSSGPSSHTTLVSPQTPQPETFHWPDVQELRSKYTQDMESNSSKVSHTCTVLHETPDSPLNRCRGSSQKYSSSSDLHKALADCPRSKSVPVHRAGRYGVEDWPQLQGRSVLCRWSSLDHMLSSHPLHEVQNLQHPVRPHHTTSQLCLASRDNGKNSNLPEGLDSGTRTGLSSGKMTESNIVKSLRERFQNLSTSS